MEKRIIAKWLNSEKESFVHLETIKKCPMCHTAHSGSHLNAYIIPKTFDGYYGREPGSVVYVASLCEACEQVFLSAYAKKDSDLHYTFIESIPELVETKEFDSRISAVFPRFVTIYQQAQKAEENHLDEICGMGYRKALECLIKDYLISFVGESRETIEKMELGNCIHNKIENPQIKKLAEKCAWLGNDFSHYVAKHTEGLEALKELVEATVYYIGMECVSRESDAIERK